MNSKPKRESKTQSAATGASELMKKVMTIGVGTLFLSEEGIRGLVGDFKLPTELIGVILEAANKTKKEFLQGLSQDVIKQISERVDPMAFLTEFLSKNEVELKISIGVKPKDRK
jgi:biotin synthase-related radical SAM superfamily protein